MNSITDSKMYASTVLLIVFVVSNVHCNVIAACNQKENFNTYFDVALLLLSKARSNILTEGSGSDKPRDCLDVLQMGKNESGVYEIWPMNRLTEDTSLKVYCDMDTDGGGWTVIQRRGDFQRSKDYFNQDWKNYKVGFGDIKTDFWLGNDNIFALTNQKLYSARFDLMDVEQYKKYALYDEFWIDDENNKYTLHISQYSGNAGDSMTITHNNRKFSTKEQDNDSYTSKSCASDYKGGWWFYSCLTANLNGIYYKGKHSNSDYGVHWNSWKGTTESLEWTEIKIRPKKFMSS